MMSKIGCVLCMILALVFAACGGGGGEDDGGADPGQDAGVDAGTDAGSDAGTDAGQDAGYDAGTDAGYDAGTDAGHDAGYDAGTDAGTDAGYDAGYDAGVDAGADEEPGERDPRITSDPDPDEVACDGATCIPSQGEVCCVKMTGMECTSADACSGFASPASCDGPEDCPAGEHCCVGFPAGARCIADGCTGSDQELCNYSNDCPGAYCTACKGPGSDLVYGLCTPDDTCPSPYTEP